MNLYLDFETYSETPISHGTYAYVQECEVMLAAWAIDDDSVQCWDATDTPEIPDDLVKAIGAADTITAHNAVFDRNVLGGALGIDTPIIQWRCTLVKALAHALPAGLAELGDVLKTPQDKAKHKEGKALVQLFCKPRPKNSKFRRATRLTHPEEWSRFIEYAKGDIDAMRMIDTLTPSWNYSGRELELYHLDQKINDRGMAIDLDLVAAAQRAVAGEQERLAGMADTLTEGVVGSATQRDALLQHLLEAHGVLLPDMQKDTIERRLADPELPEGVKELLRIRLQSTTTSTSKYRALARGVSRDGRLRGTLQFDGASRTRRAAGRTFQPQNLPSRGLLPAEEIATGIESMKLGCESLLFGGEVMKLASSAIRGSIIAAPGCKLVVADLANIEGRIQAWLAGEDWKIQAFRDYDAGIGPDMYKLAYARAFKISPEEVSKSQRQIGKVKELMLGYEGGVGAYLTGAATYGIDLDEMATLARPDIPLDVWAEATEFYDWMVKQKRSTFGLDKDTFIVCDSLKRLWRRQHSAIASLWKELGAGAKEAVACPGNTITCRKFKLRRDGGWLRIGLPSGRALCYPAPQVDEEGLSYMGKCQYTRKWKRIRTYGGKMFENACQSLARDVLYDAMPGIEAVGYGIVLTVHDEVVCEVPDDARFNPGHLSKLLATNHLWCPGLPLAAEGFEDYRYRKG